MLTTIEELKSDHLKYLTVFGIELRNDQSLNDGMHI